MPIQMPNLGGHPQGVGFGAMGKPPTPASDPSHPAAPWAETEFNTTELDTNRPSWADPHNTQKMPAAPAKVESPFGDFGGPREMGERTALLPPDPTASPAAAALPEVNDLDHLREPGHRTALDPPVTKQMTAEILGPGAKNTAAAREAYLMQLRSRGTWVR